MKLPNAKKSFLSQLGLVYAAFTWGTTFVIVKNSLNHIDPVMLVGYRFLLSSLVLGTVLLIQKKQLFTNLKQGVFLGMLLWLLYAPQTVGLKYTSASNSVFITGLFVVFVPFLSFVFFRKIPTLIQIGSIMVALVGFWFLTGGLSVLNRGDIITIITAIAYAAHILAADHFVKKEIDPYVLSFQQFFVVGLISIIVGFLFHLNLSFGTVKTVGTILFLTLVPGLSAFVVQLVAQKYVTPVKVALLFALEPVFGAFTAWTFGGEHFVLLHGLGGLFIIVAIIFQKFQNF